MHKNTRVRAEGYDAPMPSCLVYAGLEKKTNLPAFLRPQFPIYIKALRHGTAWKGS